MPGPARDSAAGSPDSPSAKGPASQALDMMVQALELIDQCDEASVAGAHLDLAIHRWREWIDETEPK